jgi:septum formation protein
MAHLKQVILASTSPWRLRMLLDAGIQAEAVAPGVDESILSEGTPWEIAAVRAKAKALAVFEKHPDSIVIGADQVVWLPPGERFDKPKTPDRHFQQLAALRGKSHLLTTAVFMTSRERTQELQVRTTITFRGDLSDQDLETYVQTGEGRYCAGGYQVEGRGAWLIEKIDGDWFNVVGLPVLEVVGVLREWGWSMPELPSTESKG